jgi:hypothetical protein
LPERLRSHLEDRRRQVRLKDLERAANGGALKRRSHTSKVLQSKKKGLKMPMKKRAAT